MKLLLKKNQTDDEMIEIISIYNNRKLLHAMIHEDFIDIIDNIGMIHALKEKGECYVNMEIVN